MAVLVTELCVKQHNKILEIATSISEMLNEEVIVKKADDVSEKLMNLTKILVKHLEIEDETLYPIMLGCRDKEVSLMADKYIKEMGGLKKAFVDYIEKWTPFKMRREPKLFIAETKNVFAALSERIDRENNIFYPVFDQTYSTSSSFELSTTPDNSNAWRWALAGLVLFLSICCWIVLKI